MLFFPFTFTLVRIPFNQDVQNQILNILFNLCRISKTRLLTAAISGLVPYLQYFIKINSPLKQFSLPLICEMSHVGVKCHRILWQNHALETYITLLEDSYWKVNAIESIVLW